jgi:2-aminophenol/2-amino-5-chlorophenol 1,6-dioxygenase alpha subunit
VGEIVGVGLIPGLPHLLARDPASSWERLANAARELGEQFRGAGAEALMLMSTQWFTVLGHNFQARPHLRGTYVDENWYAYDYGTFDYEIDIDPGLTRGWGEEVAADGFQVHMTDYDGFPIDTGTLVAQRLLDPHRQLPIALMSCNLYAQAEVMERLGHAGARAVARFDGKVACVAVSGLSGGWANRWIEPQEDETSSPAHDAWNRRMLEWIEAGDGATALAERERYSEESEVDSQLRALPLIEGWAGGLGPAEVRAYGPVWGTGAAVVSWNNKQGGSS